jgi:hypothetical protein
VGRIQNCFNNFEAPSLILSPDRKFGRVCKAIWPTKTAENLAARIGCQQLTLAACPGAQNADPAVGIHCRVAQAALRNLLKNIKGVFTLFSVISAPESPSCKPPYDPPLMATRRPFSHQRGAH